MVQTDREALVALYNAAGGPTWYKNRNWNTDANLSEWDGIKTNDQGRVVELSLSFNNLRGPIPKELGALSKLEQLWLSENELTGPIPPELGKLAELKAFYLSENKITGPIPPELGGLGKLKTLWLRKNELAGHIPRQLGDLGALETLALGSNKLDGPIPKELGALQKLTSLSLSSNKLTGLIPKELGALSKLKKLLVGGNRLTGHIPPQLGQLRALKHLLLGINKLDGSIPAELGDLRELRVLWLDNNKLTGPLPPELGKLASLQHLRLERNLLSGPIPKELGDLSELEGLWLSYNYNKLTGPIPPELGQLQALQTLSLSNNQLSGSIPPELGDLKELEVLRLSSNELTGPIPPELENLGALTTLDLDANKLSGHIPPQLGQLGALESLSLVRNKLDGPIPAELGRLAVLECLGLGGNELTGPIPKELGHLSELEELSLSFNQLTGPIPPELGNLGALTTLDLAVNKLSDLIPLELGNLGALTTLKLGVNKLSGFIPPELGDLSELHELSLQGNELTALWDHTQDVSGVGYGGGTNSTSEALLPSQLRRLLDMLDLVNPALDRNPWAEPPESIVRKGPKGIRRYFEDLYAEPCRIQRSCVKVILVGQEAAGKTSLRQSMKASKASPTGEWKEESTVFADVEPMELEGASVRVYDCAGQVAYTGLLQMFLTPRAVCVLACSTEAFGQHQRSDGGAQQQAHDVLLLEKQAVFNWLRCISRRVPESDVILVATKCDLAGGDAGQVGRRIEDACQTWQESWVSDGMRPVRVEEGVCLTSCYTAPVRGQDEAVRGQKHFFRPGCCFAAVSEQGESSTGRKATEKGWPCDWVESTDTEPSPSLLHRLVNKSNGGGLRGAQMVLPRSWDIALTVLEAFEFGRNPVEMVVQKMADSAGEGPTATVHPKRRMYQGITADKLRAEWEKVCCELGNRGIKVTNHENALEGALSIREFDGSLVRHGKYIFLDVVWLTRILKPLLNHKDVEIFGVVRIGDIGDTPITLKDPSNIASWDRFKNEGILEPRLARAIWPAGLSDYVLPTLRSLGLAFPLEKDGDGGLVVLLSLKPGRPERVAKAVNEFSKLTPALSAGWEIFQGVPPGAIEKLLTRCASFGGVRTFWRSGVLVHGGLDQQDESEIFMMVLQYSSGDNKLTAHVHGDIGSPAPWVALSYVMSAVRVMLIEFPGLRWKGHLECPQHGDKMLLNTEAARAGDNLLLESAGCHRCSPETRGCGSAAIEILRLVDIRLDRGKIFREVKGRFGDLDGRYTFGPRPSDKNELNHQTLGEILEGVNRIEGDTQKTLKCLRSLLAPNYPYPHLVVVEEIKAQGVVGKLCGTFRKDVRLYFLCPVDKRKVPCGNGGEGYRFRQKRDWVKTISPVLQVAMVTARVALKAATGLTLDDTVFLEAVSNGLAEKLVDRILDEEVLSSFVSGEEIASANMQDMQRAARASYEILKEFMIEKELESRGNAGYKDFRESMQRVEDENGGIVWVRNENVQTWRDSLSAAAPAR